MTEMRDEQDLLVRPSAQGCREQRDRGGERVRLDVDLELERGAGGEPGPQAIADAWRDHETPATRLVLAPPERGVVERVALVVALPDRRHETTRGGGEAGGGGLGHRGVGVGLR